MGKISEFVRSVGHSKMSPGRELVNLAGQIRLMVHGIVDEEHPTSRARTRLEDIVDYTGRITAIAKKMPQGRIPKE